MTYASEVLPLLPLALPTWPTKCCGVKDKLLRPRNEVESLGCWKGGGTERCSLPATCSSERKSRSFPLYYHSAFAVRFFFPGTVGNLHPPRCSAAARQQHPSTSSHGSSPAAPGAGCAGEKPWANTLTYVSRLLQTSPHSLWVSGGQWRRWQSKGRLVLKAVLESVLPYSSSGLAACRDGHDGRVQPWCKIRQAWIFCCAFMVRWLRYSILLQRWKCRRGCRYLLCSNTVPCAAQGSKMQRTLPSSPQGSSW